MRYVGRYVVVLVLLLTVSSVHVALLSSGEYPAHVVINELVPDPVSDWNFDGEADSTADEFIELATVEWDEAVAMCLDGRIADAKSIAKAKGYRNYGLDLTKGRVHDSLKAGVLESNGPDSYGNWDEQLASHPCAGASWLKPERGRFVLDDDFYGASGGMFADPTPFCGLFRK